MVNLGQQIQAQQETQAPQRATRSQRLQFLQEAGKDEALKQKAFQIQEEQFKDKVVTKQETYYDYRPTEYSEKQWNRLKQDQRDAILRDYKKGRGLDYYADRGLLVKTSKTRTVSETIPFTLDEGENSYEKIYAGLAPELKEYFTSPETLKQERSQRIQTNIARSQERVEFAKSRLTQLKEKY
jgi:hypothetical protein